ncbi:BREX-1 system adenine-specific DNA-methyltransferase PglX [Luteimonas sp. gir]|uniref:BREX-1 system adenine-specific DNA-methyltransferase PglX n=1 Tax=Luteimonas sp. gir TaxID=3127960 RepID=UPI003075E811
MTENQSDRHEKPMEKVFFRVPSADFKKIASSPIAYWLSEPAFAAFEGGSFLRDVATTRVGMATGDNERFVRYWHEVSSQKIGINLNREQASKSEKKWFPYANGGEARKWYANYSHVVNWENDGAILQTDLHESGRVRAHNFNLDKIFKPGLTWSLINSTYNAIRVLPAGFLFSSGAPSLFSESAAELPVICGYYNSSVTAYLLSAINPTINNNSGDADKLPYQFSPHQKAAVSKCVTTAIDLARGDWNSFETSWDFADFPLLSVDYRQTTLKASYQNLRTHWREMALEMQRLEEENNRIFINAYGLQGELTPEVPLNEITLTCNPHYRYGGDKSEDELEALLQADTMRELVSYAVGCMFGRYSLDKPGLILANQGDTLADYLVQVPQPRFPADDDNVIPLLDGDWFADDITLRLRQFLRVAFGDAHYEDNLAFIELALNIKCKRNYDLRDYLLGEFYADHVKRYKKRPIYWLFSSPKGSFNALIYMHRYRPDTVSVVLRYLRDYREKLATEKERQAAISINPASSQGDKTRALKETDRLAKVLAELEDYERDVLYPLATQQVQIDLDDGVKVNYLKFERALKKIPGLAAKDED